MTPYPVCVPVAVLPERQYAVAVKTALCLYLSVVPRAFATRTTTVPIAAMTAMTRIYAPFGFY